MYDVTPRINQVAARSPATPIMLSDVSAERRTLLLPSMQSREYYSEPSVDDLARWAKSDPSYLEAVPNLLGKFHTRFVFYETRYAESALTHASLTFLAE